MGRSGAGHYAVGSDAHGTSLPRNPHLAARSAVIGWSLNRLAHDSHNLSLKEEPVTPTYWLMPAISGTNTVSSEDKGMRNSGNPYEYGINSYCWK